MYTLDELRGWNVRTSRDVKWVLARPLPLFGLVAIWQRLRDAYLVLIGRADAFTWPEGQ